MREYEFADRISNLKPSIIREILKGQDASVIPFSAGNPAAASFPFEEMRILSDEIFRNNAPLALQYSITEGYGPLREKVKARIKEKKNIGREYDDLIIVSGGQQAIHLATAALCNEGDTVLCEDPSFIGALNAFRAFNLKLKGVTLEDDGINIEELEALLTEDKKVKLLYLIPNFQNPAGSTMSLAKRKAALALCKKHGVIVLEDDPYGDLRFRGEEIATMKSMDEDGDVIYCGSFSKTLSAGIRLGFVSAHKSIIAKMTVFKQTSDVHTNMFFQLLADMYLARYDFDAHIEKIRGLYREKSSLMATEIKTHFPKEVKVSKPEGGLFVWCTLPDNLDGIEFAKLSTANKVAVVPGTAFCAKENAFSPSFRMNYSTPTNEHIVKGVEILGGLLKDFIKK